jgi:hypothetical protein
VAPVASRRRRMASTSGLGSLTTRWTCSMDFVFKVLARSGLHGWAFRAWRRRDAGPDSRTCGSPTGVGKPNGGCTAANVSPLTKSCSQNPGQAGQRRNSRPLKGNRPVHRGTAQGQGQAKKRHGQVSTTSKATRVLPERLEFVDSSGNATSNAC